MRLKDWQKQENLTDAELAEKLSVDRSYIFRLNNGERRASPDLALRIEQISGGKVSRTEMIWP